MSKNKEKAPETKPVETNGVLDAVLPESAREALGRDEDFAAGIIEELAEQAKETTPKTGNPTKAAREAQNTLQFVSVVLPTFNAINRTVSKKWPEFYYTDEERQLVVETLIPVLKKYAGRLQFEYEEELMLALVLGGTLTEKYMAYSKRVAKERRAERETGDPNAANERADEK